MSTLTVRPAGTDRIATTRGVIVAAGVAAAVGCAGYISTIFLLSDLSIRDAARSPVTVTSNLLVAVSFAALAAGLPALMAAARLPRWASILAAVGCVFVAAGAWGTGTLAVHAAGMLTDAQMDQNSFWFTLFQAGQSLPAGIGFLALAVAGWRRRTISRGASALLLAAGAASLLPAYPPGALLASVALVWIARTARTDPETPAG